jgi:hypothetical protein
MSDNIIVSPSVFHGKLNEYIIEAPGRMYIFEITKLCGYSTFVFMYKDETMLDLYNRVSHHFGCKDIKGLYIDNHLFKSLNDNINDNKNMNINTNNNNTNNSNNNSNNNCCKKPDNLIPVPVSSLTTVKEFVFNNTAKEPRNLEPVYKIPFPVVYRVYLDDGHCHCCL